MPRAYSTGFWNAVGYLDLRAGQRGICNKPVANDFVPLICYVEAALHTANMSSV